jgi:histidinol phosphatase-like enzyme
MKKVGHLRNSWVNVAVVTNQAGPLWREATGQDKYPDAQSIGEALLSQLIDFMQVTRENSLWCISLYDQKAVDLINKSIDPQAAQEYETPDEILARLKDVICKETDRFNAWVGITPSWRKPNPGMLDFAMSHYGTSSEDTLMIGDREEDKLAAEAAFVDFQYEWQFFGGDSPIIV